MFADLEKDKKEHRVGNEIDWSLEIRFSEPTFVYPTAEKHRKRAERDLNKAKVATWKKNSVSGVDNRSGVVESKRRGGSE